MHQILRMLTVTYLLEIRPRVTVAGVDLVSDIAIFVLKRDVKLQLTN